MEKELEFILKELSPPELEKLRKKIVREMKKYDLSEKVSEICECSIRHVQSVWKKYCENGRKNSFKRK